MTPLSKRKHFLDGYRFPGFTLRADARGLFGARWPGSLPSCVAQKTVCPEGGRVPTAWYDRTARRVRDLNGLPARLILEHFELTCIASVYNQFRILRALLLPPLVSLLAGSVWQ
jgi:hypothetical protein